VETKGALPWERSNNGAKRNVGGRNNEPERAMAMGLGTNMFWTKPMMVVVTRASMATHAAATKRAVVTMRANDEELCIDFTARWKQRQW